jgi:hypothetical protein
MKKIYTIVLVTLSLTSCNWKNSKEEKPKEVDVANEVVLGGDKDANGCLASAGYTWSKLNKECVRIFTGVQLLPAEKVDAAEDEAVLAAYILFDKTKDNAEIFLPNQDESIILKRESEGKPWVNGSWQLIPWKGFVLKKDGKILYSGDGQIGSTVTGSDDSEEIPVTE